MSTRKSHSSPDLTCFDWEASTLIATTPEYEDDKASESVLPSSPNQPALQRPRSRSNIIGRVVALSKDYAGCRYLQQCLEEGGRPTFDIIFAEVMFEAPYLAGHASANYLCQKLLERCCQRERFAFLTAIRNQLLNLGFTMHGTRVIQRLIEFGSQEEEISLITAEIQPFFYTLCQDPNGIHCIQSCLAVTNRYNGGYNWIFDSVAAQCQKLSTNPVSCSVVQRCIEKATLPYRTLLAGAIIDCSLNLVTDPYGNYVVQNVLDMDNRCIRRRLISALAGSAYRLAVLKFSSNVIEKCLQVADDDLLEVLLEELFQGGQSIGTLLCDPYGNYCVQAALRVYEGSAQEKFDNLVDRILPFMPLLKINMFRKRIYTKMLKRFPALDPELDTRKLDRSRISSNLLAIHCNNK